MKLVLKELSEDKKIPLSAIADVSAALNSIFKEAYRELSGNQHRRRVPELKIYATEFANGSFISDLMIEIINKNHDPTQLVLALAAFTPSDVLTVAQNAINFWKMFWRAKQEGTNLEIKTDPNSFAIVNTGNGSVNIGAVVLNTASRIPKAGDQLTKPIRRGDLKEIEFLENTDSPLIIGANDGNCFSTPMEMDKDVKESIGDLVEFDKRRGTGTFMYSNESGTPETKSFSLIGSAAVGDAIDSMKQNKCRLHFHEEYIQLPNDRRAVVRLHVVKIDII